MNGDPWARFRVYNRKLARIELSNDKEIGKEMPNHWFLCLFHLPSRPRDMFPKLSELVVSSVAGLNSVIPFHIANGLRRVTIKDITKNGNYEGQTKMVAMSLMTGLACTSPALEYLSMHSPVTTPMTTLLSKFSSLTSLVVSVPSPTPTDTLANIAALPNLSFLKLLSQGLTGTPMIPRPGQHLEKYHPMQGTSSPSRLEVEGDPSFVYWATLFFASPALLGYRALIPNKDSMPVQCILLVPHVIDTLARQCTNAQDISVLSGATWNDSSLSPFENEPSFQPPTTVLQSISKLRSLQCFTIKNVPFATRDFAYRLVSQLTEMKELSLLWMEPFPLSPQPHHALVLPGLDTLRDVSVNHPKLRYLYITLDISTIPAPSSDLVFALPGHPLEKLFITPRNRAEPPQVSELVAYATYLDRLFPNLYDLTSHFSTMGRTASPAQASALALWKDVDPLLKTFQAMRKQYAAAVPHQVAS